MVKWGNIFIPLSGKRDFGGSFMKTKITQKPKIKPRLKERQIEVLIETIGIPQNEVD